MIKLLNLKKGQVLKKSIASIVLMLFVFSLFPLNPALVFANESSEQTVVSDNVYSTTIKNKKEEIKERRTDASKTFDNGNGTYTTHLYSAPIHFQQDDEWIEIDNTIQPTTNGEYKNKSNKFKVKFGSGSRSQNLSAVEYKDFKVVYSLVDLPSLGTKFHINPRDIEPKIDGNIITFEEVFPKVDLRQTVLDNEVKEDFVLKEFTGKNSFAFSLKTTGVEAIKEQDGSIGFYKKGNTNEKIFSIPKPYMIDSKIDEKSGEPARSDDVDMDLKQSGSDIYITITADEDWLKSPERVYPVYIDPTTNINDNGDAFVMSAYPTTNYNSSWNGSYYELKTGYYDSTTGTNYSYLKFDTSPINGKLVTSATLKVYCAHSYYATTANGIWLDTVNGSWSPSTLTWNNKPSSTALTSTSTVRNTWASFNVTKPVAGWASSPAKSTNYGFKLHTNGNGKSHWKKFRSMENSTNKPYIAVTYSEIPAAPTGTAYGNAVNNKTGYVNLSWAPVSGATGYKVLIFNGKEYEEWNVGNVTSWSTKDKKIWPTASEISVGRYLLHHDVLGAELADKPSPVYVNSGGAYPTHQNYWFRVKAYSSNGQTAYSNAYTPTLPDRTAPPTVSSVAIGGTNGAYGGGDKATVTATWTGVNDAATGSNYGTSYYKVELTKTDLKTNAVTTTSTNVTHTGTGTHSYTFSSQPDYTKFQLKVTTYDKNGNYSGVKTSTTWTSADRTNPTASITAPTAITVGGTVSISGTATDIIALGNYKVEYGAGTAPTTWTLIKSATTPISNGALASWNTSALNGSYTIKLTVTDAAGNTASATKALTVDNTIPVATIDSPLEGSYIGGTVEITGSASDVNFKDYKLEYGSGTSPSSWTLIKSSSSKVSNGLLSSWDTTSLADGTYTLKLTVSDQLNRTKTDSIVVHKDTTLPSASISSPVNDSTNVYKGLITVTGTAKDTNIDSYTVEYGEGSSPTTWNLLETGETSITNGDLATLDTKTLENGTYTIKLTVTDKAGQIKTSVATFTVDNTAPTVAFVSPTDGDTLKDQITIEGAIDDNNPTNLKLNLSVRKFGSGYLQNLGDKTGSSNSWSWDSSKLPDSEYVLILTGTDKAGNETVVETNIKVENLAVGLGTEQHWGTVDNQYGQVNITNGNFTISQNDIDLPGRGLGTEVTRIYNSQMKTNGSLGRGWRFVIPELSEYGDGAVVITDGDGTKHTYTRNEDGSYNRPTGNYISLTKNADSTFTWKFKDGQEYIFDQAGRKVSLKDKNGNTVVYLFDTNNNLIKIIDHTNRNTDFSYDHTIGRLTSITDYTDRSWVFSYDTKGNLIKAVDPTGKAISYAYNENNVLSSITDARGNATGFTYAEGKLTAVRDAKGHTTSYAYDVSMEQFTEEDTRGNITEYKYDENWNIVSITDAIDGNTSFTYDENYNLLSKTNALGKQTSYTYDEMGNMLSETNPLGHTTTYTYNARNDLVSSTNPLGEITTNTYDTKGNLTKDGTNTYTFDTYGQMVTSTDGNGNTTSYSYDTNGNLIQVTDALENSTTYEYDARGNKSSETDATGNQTSYTYDKLGQMLSVVVSSGDETTYTYDANGNRLTATDAAGNITTWEYDELNRVEKVTEPENKIKSSTYDVNGNLLTETVPDGKVTSYSYDALNRVQEITYPDGKKVLYTYDAVDNRLTMTDSNGTTNYEYDDDSKLIKETDYADRITTYNYDSAGRLTSKTVNGKNTTFNYDSKYNLVSLIDSNNKTTSFGYDENKNRTTTNYPNSAKINFSYDNGNRLNNVKNLGPTDNVLSNFAYTHYNNNQIKTTSNGEGTTTYEYDGENSLVKITGPTGKITTYTYDEVGNRTSVTNTENGTSVTTDYIYDVATNQLQRVTKPGGSPVNYTYDSNGRTLTKVDSSGTTSYQYNPENQLLKVTKPNGDTVEFTYDGDNRRTSKVAKTGGNAITTKYIYDGDLIAAETDANGNVTATYTYDNNGVPVNVTKGSETYYFHYNGHGDVVVLTDASGDVVTTYEYDEWGNVLNKTGTIDTPFGYAGQFGYVYDEETGLYFLKSRYYDAEIGRFTTKDRFMGFENRPASQNPYTYAENDPVNKVDPDGYVAILPGAFIGAVIAFGTYWLECKLGMRTWNWVHVGKNVALAAVLGGIGGGMAGVGKMAGLLQRAGYSKKFISKVRTYNFLKGFILNGTHKRSQMKMGWVKWANLTFKSLLKSR